MRMCVKCQILKPITFFNRDRTRVDGLYPQCKDCSRAACRKTYRVHHAKHVGLKRAWKTANRERHREISRAWQIANPTKNREGTRRYRLAKIQATPPWANKKSLKMFEKDCPPGWHIDHIEPLRAKDRCGLNVIWNLQYLPADQSRRKGNRTGENFAMGGYYL